ncbi:MAG: diacylglycerol kinase family protein [Candidatus Binatia bacterium]
MGGIGVIVNPHASGNKRRPRRVARFASIVGEDGEVVATSDLAELDTVLERFRDDGVEIVAVCGGDGSFFHVISRMVPLWGERPLPLLLPLRAGTINNLARTIGARRRRAESMLAHVIKDYRQGRTHEVTQRNLIRVNGEHYGYIVGAGLITNFLSLYYSGRKPGPLRAFGLLAVCGVSWIFGTSLIGAVVKTIEADVECDGERVPFRSYTMILASSVAHIGLGVKPFYLSARKRGYYHLLAGSSTAGQLLSKLWRFFRGFPAGLDNLYDNLAARVVIEFAEPQAYTINGEILDPVRVLTLEPGPRVSFVRG